MKYTSVEEPRSGVTKPGALLALAAVAVAFAAADTYVVVLALPDMMLTVGLPADRLQQAAPIVSGFLLGYVAMLPLIGRLADIRGRIPVLTAALVIFSFGSLITALSHDLPSLVAGRLLQGLGGGGLVPATIALVADLYEPKRRALPLGIVSAVQEFGAVIGPLYGAAVIAVADWQAIFWINLAAGLVLAAAVAASRGGVRHRTRRRYDWIGLGLLGLSIAALILAISQPGPLVRDVVLGWPFVPLVGDSQWLAPMSLVACALFAITLVWLVMARQPAIDVRGWIASARSADLTGAGLLGAVLASVIIAFASADPSAARFSASAWWWLGGGVLLAGAFLVHLRRSANPLVPRGALRARPAWSSLVCNLLTGVALIAALVDVPVFARTTIYADSQLDAALVLLQLLVAVPIGAVAGGFACRHVPYNVVAAAGLLGVAGGEALMARWDANALSGISSTPPLVLAGFGFGLCLAPLNAALLAATAPAVHGLASALAVVARMVGMLVGISVLTELGLQQFFRTERRLPAPADVCHALGACPAYERLIQGALLNELTTVFSAAAVCAIVAAVVAAFGLGGRHAS